MLDYHEAVDAEAHFVLGSGRLSTSIAVPKRGGIYAIAVDVPKWPPILYMGQTRGFPGRVRTYAAFTRRSMGVFGGYRVKYEKVLKQAEELSNSWTS
ncbi:hypothetical protein KSF73_09895 [Burkholderiaceae bacterium DAT-1]|nr:hypothetical protein [Burkholderiaceae bacterium DAT-1]